MLHTFAQRLTTPIFSSTVACWRERAGAAGRGNRYGLQALAIVLTKPSSKTEMDMHKDSIGSATIIGHEHCG